MVASMCEKAGIERKTNHSLRATGATRMFEAGVTEEMIQERTGRRRLDLSSLLLNSGEMFQIY